MVATDNIRSLRLLKKTRSQNEEIYKSLIEENDPKYLEFERFPEYNQSDVESWIKSGKEEGRNLMIVYFDGSIGIDQVYYSCEQDFLEENPPYGSVNLAAIIAKIEL